MFCSMAGTAIGGAAALVGLDNSGIKGKAVRVGDGVAMACKC